MTEEFTWCPRLGAAGDAQTNALASQFNNGYSQRLSVGINNVSTSWPVSFTGTEEYVTPIRDFFVRHKGANHFFWSPPLEAKGSFITDGGWQVQPLGGGLFTISTKFQQVFNP